MPRYRASSFRGAVRGATVARELSVACPKCAAGRGDRCLRLTSWVHDDSHRDGGFYTERQNSPHAERKAATKPGVAESPCNALRREVYALMRSKLTGAQRMQLRAWAGSIRRTEDELAAKVEELKALGDLSW